MESHRAYIAGTGYRYSAACGAPFEILCKIFNKVISVKLHIISWTKVCYLPLPRGDACSYTGAPKMEMSVWGYWWWNGEESEGAGYLGLI